MAANLCAVAVGSDTDGSIMAPSHVNSSFGLKPTLGRISGTGVIPIAHSQDTAGPMTRTATDTALLPGVVSAPAHPFSVALERGALQGVRLGLGPKYFDDWLWGAPYFKPVIDQALLVLQDLSAMFATVDTDPSWMLSGDELTVLLYEVQVAEYLATLRHCEAKTLADLIKFDSTHCWQEMKYFGQGIFEAADETSGNLLDPEYVDAPARCILNSRTLGIDKALSDYNVQTLIAPTWTFLYSFAANRRVSQHLAARRLHAVRRGWRALGSGSGRPAARLCVRRASNASTRRRARGDILDHAGKQRREGRSAVLPRPARR